MRPTFRPGKNIAVKVPAHEFEQMVHFYKEILGLPQQQLSSPDAFDSVSFEFGDKHLWVDKIAGLSQAEIWLEIETDDVAAAKQYLLEQGCVIRDDIEPLPSDFKGFWLNSPSNTIHLMSGC